MNLSVKNRTSIILSAAIGLCAFIFLNGGTISAQSASTNSLPNPPDFTQDTYLIVAQYGGGYTLDAPTSVVRIYTSSATGALLVQNGGHCPGPSAPDRGADESSAETNFRLFATNSFGARLGGGQIGARSSASLGCGNAAINYNVAVGGGQRSGSLIDPATGLGMYIIEVEAVMTSSAGGWNMFKYISDIGSYLSYYAGAGDRFAIKANGSGVPGSAGNYLIPFAPPCSNPNPGSVTLRWFDPDAGVANQNFQNPVRTVLREYGPRVTGNPSSGYELKRSTVVNISEGDSVGGQRTISTVPNNQFPRFEWVWENIYSANGIQFGIPFDSYNGRVVCGTPPCPPGSPGCPGGGGGPAATCRATNPNGSATINVNQVLPITVNVQNTGTAAWNSSFSLRQTYWSSINPNPQTLTRPLSSGPGFLSPGANGNYNFSISRVAPGVFTFSFQMQQNGTLVGSACNLVVTVQNPPPRPDCYIRHVIAGADQANNAPYEYFTTNNAPVNVHIRAQQLNPGPTDWGPRYFMTEAYSGANGAYGATNIGNLTLVTPGAFTRVFDRFHTLNVGTHTFTYWVYLTTPAGVTGPAAGTTPCSISVTVTNIVYNPSGGITQADCGVISGNLSVPTVPNPTGFLRIVDTPTNEFEGVERPFTASGGSFSFSTFSGWTQPIRPDLPYTVQLFGRGSDGQVRDASGNVGQPLATFSFGPCLSGCSPTLGVTGNPEPGESITISNLGLLVDNSASQSFSGMYTLYVTASPGLAGFPRSQGVTIPAGPGSRQVALAPFSASFTNRTTFRAELRISSSNTPIFGCENGPIIPATRPYFKVYGSDIYAGGAFNPDNGTACGPPPSPAGGIRAFARVISPPNGTDKRGSGAEYGVLSLGLIEGSINSSNGFYSADLHARAARYTTFANSTANWGGSFGGSHCINNYWFETSGGQDPSTNNDGTLGGTINSLPGDGRYYRNGDLTISGFNVANTQQVTLYVNGNVYIRGNTTYSQVGDYYDPDTIPYLTVIARGNIYVDGSVTQIAGLYIAQPRPAVSNSGSFVTCAIAGGAGLVEPTDFTSQCTQKLTVNGAVVAQLMRLWRLGNTTTTLINAPANESSAMYGGSNNAREEFNFIPDIVLGIPAFVRDDDQPIQAIYSAPPLF